MQEQMIQFESEGFSPSTGKPAGIASPSFEDALTVQALVRRVPWNFLAGLSLLLQVCLLASLVPAWRIDATLFPLTVQTLPELGTIVVAMLIFAISWHTYVNHRPGNLLILAYGFLAAGLLNAAHMLSQFGMVGGVSMDSMGQAAGFCLAGRYAVALSLAAAAFLPWRPLPAPRMRYGLLVTSLGLVTLACWLAFSFPQLWQGAFIGGQKTSACRMIAECGSVALALFAAFRFYQATMQPQSWDAASLCAAAIALVLSECSFTLQGSANDIFLLLGLFYQFVACCFAYRAVFASGVREPYQRMHTALIESKSAEHLVKYLGYYDPLTRLPNRLMLKDRFQRAIAQAKRTKTKTALLCIDLDNFKAINNSLGHASGDALLKIVAERFDDCLRGTDTIARLGSDEFAIVLQDISVADAIVLPLGRMMEMMQQSFEIDGRQLGISMSVGIALYPDDGGDFDALMKKADMAMSRAKETGRNAYCFFDEQMDVEALELLRMRNDLRMALERNEFVLHYQPQIDVMSGAVVGAEALIRWHHPEQGMIPPGRFIPLAEESGLIVPIGEWVLREACRQAQAWRQAGLSPLVMSANLSGVQFMRGNVERTVKDALDESGLPASFLELELTESILIQGAETVLATIGRLKAAGVKFAIDDFGTGYSSLAYLKRFAVDRLKIDRSFIRDLSSDACDVAIVRAVIQMAHGLGLRTVAEGVEDAQVLTQLQLLQCDHIQGYYFAKPMPAEAFAQYLEEAGNGSVAPRAE